MSSIANNKFVMANTILATLRQMPKSRLPELIAKRMEDADLSFRDVEKRSGDKISANYVHDLRNGKYDPLNVAVSKLVALAKGLGESPIVIFEAVLGKGPNGIKDETLAQMLEDYASLPAREREELQLLIEVLREKIQERLPN